MPREEITSQAIMQHIVFFSGGAASYAAAKRVVERHGPQNVCLLFTDTCMEDEDLYRFLDDAEAKLGARLERIADGRTPWQVFREARFLGNTRVDLCSRILKRELARQWIKEHYSSDEVTLYIGMDWTELHRYERAAPRWKPWSLEAPLIDSPPLDKCAALRIVESDGLVLPRLYKMDFPHNNCGGFCVKAGQAHFAHLLRALPDRYAYHETQEQDMRDMLGDVSILRDRRGGLTKPMTLRAFRGRVASNDYDETEWGGCGCFVDAES